ncbi:type IV pilus biogenesis protein PilM [Undibacterium arcticum]
MKNQARTEATAIAGNMMLYRNYVVSYSRANQGISGTVADASLNLPTWFNRNSRLMNYMNAGKGYVYYTPTRSDLAYQVAKGLGASINAGIKTNGNLISPFSTTNTSTPIAVPAAIPDGSIVIIP